MAWDTPSIVQAPTATTSASGTSRAITFGSNVAAGNYLVLAVSIWSLPGPDHVHILGVTDTRGNTWRRAIGQHSGRAVVEIWYAPSASAGTCTITATLPSANSASQTSLICCEADGIEGLVSAAYHLPPSSTTPSIPVTNRADNAMVIMAMTTLASDPTMAAGAGTTLIQEQEDSTNFQQLLVEYKNATSIASQTLGVTLSPAEATLMVAAEFVAKQTLGVPSGAVTGVPIVFFMPEEGAAAALTGSASLTVTGASALTTAIRFTGQATATVTASSTLTTAIRFSSTANLTVSTASALTTSIRLAGAATANLTTASSLTTAIRPTGTASLTLTASGVVTNTAAALVGAASLTLTATGAMEAVGAALAGTASLAVTAGSALTTSIRLAGASTATLTSASSLSTAIRFAGTSILAATASGTIAGTAAALQGEADGEMDGSGELTTEIALVGISTVQLTATSNLSTAIRLVGVSALDVTASASMAPAIDPTADVSIVVRADDVVLRIGADDVLVLVRGDPMFVSVGADDVAVLVAADDYRIAA